MPSYRYYQLEGGEEAWQPVPVAMHDKLVQEKKPKFTTVLSVSQLVEDLAREDRDKLRYLGGLYFDWDAKDGIDTATLKCASMLLHMEQEMGLDLEMVRLYATGGRGYHAEIPMECFMAKVPKAGIAYLPVIYKRIALDMAVDTLDLRVYSGGRGRMWRTPNVQRDNGHYKVAISWDELRSMTEERYDQITSSPRQPIPLKSAEQCLGLSIAFDKAKQDVDSQIAKRKKKTSDTSILKKLSLPSLKAMMEGRGIKADTGFHQLSLQLGIIADNYGWDEDRLVKECEGLIEAHTGDGKRYNTAEKRREELVRMHRYTSDNPCYEFSVGALKVLLNHEAPDLDGIPVTKAEVEKVIEEAVKEAAKPVSEKQAAAEAEILDAYSDVAGMVDMTKYGIYVDTEHGKKRICAISFDNVHILRDISTGLVSCYEAEVLVNGKSVGRQTLELETFSGLQAFNRFCSRLAHVMQGLDQHVRAVMMRVAQKGVKEGKTYYVLKREGLDILSIPGHENELLRKPFLAWADNRGVMTNQAIAGTGIQFSFQGYPDPRGQFKTDIADAPELADWIEQPGNKGELRELLVNWFSCQRPDVTGNLIGWYTACFYRKLFHANYEKFPLLHVNGAAGAGKTEMNLAWLSLFYFQQEPKSLTPNSSVFALQQHASGSASIPLLIDEYKPHEMAFDLHNRLKLMFRDAYNNRDVMRGGGNRDNDDYRALSSSQLSAPMVFIGEVMEEEPAVMERVVLATVVRPPSTVAMVWYSRFQEFFKRRQILAILGQYIATELVLEYKPEQLREEFDEVYNFSRKRYMLSQEDLDSGKLSEDQIREKQGAKERTVFNFSVSKFGLLKFKKLIDQIFGPEEFAESFAACEEAIFQRVSDLLPATQAEYLKVLTVMAHMSFNDPDKPGSLIRGTHYTMCDYGGKTAIEFSMRTAYHMYRIHCKNIGYKPLFSGDTAFLHAMRDSSALLEQGPAKHLQSGGSTLIFDWEELRKMGVDDFNEGKG
jgi:hypothetical protein